jgi:hypothetical protein
MQIMIGLGYKQRSKAVVGGMVGEYLLVVVVGGVVAGDDAAEREAVCPPGLAGGETDLSVLQRDDVVPHHCEVHHVRR